MSMTAATQFDRTPTWQAGQASRSTVDQPACVPCVLGGRYVDGLQPCLDGRRVISSVRCGCRPVIDGRRALASDTHRRPHATVDSDDIVRRYN